MKIAYFTVNNTQNTNRIILRFNEMTIQKYFSFKYHHRPKNRKFEV